MKPKFAGMFSLTILVILLINPSSARDCFSWTVTKRANYIEILPALMYWPKITYMMLDSQASCSFIAKRDAFANSYSSQIVSTYQGYSI